MGEPAGSPIEDEQSRVAPFGRRLLRDQLRRKVEIEIADVHDSSALLCQWIIRVR
jgi:hypothetical protein